MEASIDFREAVPDDIPTIQRLASIIWRDHYPGIIPSAQIDYMLERMYDGNMIRDEMLERGYRYVLVLEQGEPIGFLSYLHDAADRSVKLSKLYLLRARHGRGIGSRMLALVRDEAVRRGASIVYLFVNKANEKAILAYERAGYEKAGAVVTDIGGGFVMDDFRMVLRL